MSRHPAWKINKIQAHLNPLRRPNGQDRKYEGWISVDKVSRAARDIPAKLSKLCSIREVVTAKLPAYKTLYTGVMNVISVIIGIVALVVALVGFIPLLGIINWIAIPIAVVGLVVGMFDTRTSGRNLNAVVIVFSAVRLFLGGGIL